LRYQDITPKEVLTHTLCTSVKVNTEYGKHRDRFALWKRSNYPI